MTTYTDLDAAIDRVLEESAALTAEIAAAQLEITELQEEIAELLEEVFGE